MARELTSDEKTAYRKQGNGSNKYLAIAQYNVIYTARLNGIPTSTDRVSQINHDGNSGNLADLRDDMTVYIGSVAGGGTGVNAYDLGMVRLRRASDASSSLFYIGETSDIAWEDNVYLTIVDDYQIRPKHNKIVSGVPFIDTDLAFSDQHTVFDPVPVLGTHHAAFLDETDEGEKITNGMFTTNTTGWTAGTGVLLSIISNHLHIDRNGAGVIDHAKQTIKTKAGKTYELSVNIISYTHGYEVYADGNLLFDDAQSTGIHTTQFVASGSTAVIAFRAVDNSGATLDIDSVSVNQVPLVSVLLGPGADSESWCLDSTIASVLWEIPGALSVDDLTLVNPTATFDTYGTYLAYCTPTADNAKTAWGVRYIMVFDKAHPPITDFEITNRHVNYSDGGWTFDVKIFSGAQETVIRDHSLVVLFSENYNDDGRFYRPCPIEGAEDIDCVGYISTRDITRDYDKGSAAFGVDGAAEFLKLETGNVCSLELVTVPTAWNQMPLLTVTRFVWHFLYYRTTVMRVMDVTLPPDELYDLLFNSMQNSLWDQVKEISEPKLFALPGVDCYGRFWLEIDSQMVPVVDRTWPVVQDLEEQDWQGNLDRSKDTKSESGVIASAGIAVSASGTSSTYYSLSPGHDPKVFGGADDIMDNVPLVTGQDNSNDLCGLLAGWRNNPDKYFTIPLVHNYKAADLWPRQFFSITIDPADDPRGIGYSGNLIPRELSYEYDPKSGYEYLVMVAEAEAFPEIAITGDTPIPDSNEDFFNNFSDFGTGGDGLDLPLEDPVIPGGDPWLNVADAPPHVLIHDANHAMWYTDSFDQVEPVWVNASSGLTSHSEGITNYDTPLDFVIWLSTGEVYVSAGSPSDGPSGVTGLWYASGPLAGYTQLLDRQTLCNTWNGAPVDISLSPWIYVRIGSVGINRANGILLINMNMGTGLGSGNMLIGNNADGFDMTDDAQIGFYYALSYGGGKWVGTPDANAYVAKFNPDGTFDEEFVISMEFHLYHTRIGTSDSLYAWNAADGISLVQGNGDTIGDVFTVDGDGVIGLATDTTGQFIMAIVSTGLTTSELKKSLDGGANWSPAIELPVDFPVLVNDIFCIDADRWIVCGSATDNTVDGNVIAYTNDFGITWQDKKGNLVDLVATMDGANLLIDTIQALP